ncbi:MAG: MFS transporter [Smithellaceae bacterium]|nr:MFS transporter [Smithellaceae bacterium]
MSDKTNAYPPIYLAWLVWGLGAVLYFTGFYQRVAPAVMTDLLMLDFQIGAAALGNLSAFYFYSYVAMQVPTGIIADRWGPRKLLTTGSLIASLGIFLFALAPSIYLANLGRFLIGGSVAVAWVAMLKLASHWFPPSRFATVTGIALCCGVIGAVTAGVPLRFLIDAYGWRSVFFFSGLVTFILTLAIWLMVRDDPTEKGFRSYFLTPNNSEVEKERPRVLASLRQIFSYRNAWLLVVAPSGIVGPLLAFSGLWGVPFLTTHYGLTPTEGAAITSSLLIAWAAGGPCMGALSDRIGKRRPVYLVGAGVAAAGWAVVLFTPGLPLALLTVLVIMIGFGSGSMVLGFAFIKESVPPFLGGTASGVCNAGVMMGPMILQPAVGLILDLGWRGEMVGGVRIYGLAAYRQGFALMMLWSLLAFALIYFTRETHCRQTVESDADVGCVSEA